MKKKKLIFYSLTNVMIIGIIGYYFLFVKERLKAPNWNLQTNAIIIEGIERTFDFFVPENLSSSPSLVFLLELFGPSSLMVSSFVPKLDQTKFMSAYHFLFLDSKTIITS